MSEEKTFEEFVLDMHTRNDSTYVRDVMMYVLGAALDEKYETYAFSPKWPARVKDVAWVEPMIATLIEDEQVQKALLTGVRSGIEQPNAERYINYRMQQYMEKHDLQVPAEIVAKVKQDVETNGLQPLVREAAPRCMTTPSKPTETRCC